MPKDTNKKEMILAPEMYHEKLEEIKKRAEAGLPIQTGHDNRLSVVENEECAASVLRDLARPDEQPALSSLLKNTDSDSNA